MKRWIPATAVALCLTAALPAQAAGFDLELNVWARVQAVLDQAVDWLVGADTPETDLETVHGRAGFLIEPNGQPAPDAPPQDDAGSASRSGFDIEPNG